MKCVFIILLIFIVDNSNAQYSGVFFAKEFSKEAALYRAKSFVMSEVLGSSANVVEFQIDPLSAATSGELTSLVYKCPEKKMEGLVLGFFGNRWNESGVIYQAYAFKNFSKETALEMLNKIEVSLKEHTKFLKADYDNNNIYFKFDDITFLIYSSANINGFQRIRVFWKEFDSEWDFNAFKRTKKNLISKLEKE